MKKNYNFLQGMITCFSLAIFSIFSLNTLQAQCVSALGHTYSISSTALAPTQCTYNVNVCITVNDPTISFIKFSISTGANTDSENVLAPFTAGQIVCQQLEIIIPNCDELSLVNIDVEGSDPTCSIANYDGPLDTGAGPLAVEFAYLQGYQSKNEIMIEWITASENNNDYFEIEHSRDGRHFEYVETINGSGNSTDASAYNYMHRFPYNGMNYYRVKMVEFDGSFTHSNVISIELESKDIVNIFPTSVDAELNIKIFNSNIENTPVHIFSATGNRIGEYTIVAGDNSLQIPTSNLTAGLYYVKIKLQGEGVITKPFIKKTL